MTSQPNHRPGRIDVPLSVWPGPGTTADVAAALIDRLTHPGEAVALIDTTADPAALAASARRLLWVQTSRRVHDTVQSELARLTPADRSRLDVRCVPRSGLAEPLEQCASRMRLVVAPDRIAAQAEVWRATVGLLRPAGRLALIGNAATGIVATAAEAAGLVYQAHVVCAATWVYEHASTAAEHLDEIALPVALTRTHIDVRVFTRGDAEEVDRDA